MDTPVTPPLGPSGAATVPASSEPSRDGRTRLLLALICIPLIGVGMTLANSSSKTAPVAVQPINPGDVTNATLVEIRDHRGDTVYSGEFHGRRDVLGNTEKVAALMQRGGRTIVGKVELENPAPGRQNRRPELGVDIVGLTPGKTFTVVIEDRVVGLFVSDDAGSVNMELLEGGPPAPLK
jgi:hypothetical protein